MIRWAIAILRLRRDLRQALNQEHTPQAERPAF